METKITLKLKPSARRVAKIFNRTLRNGCLLKIFIEQIDNIMLDEKNYLEQLREFSSMSFRSKLSKMIDNARAVHIFARDLAKGSDPLEDEYIKELSDFINDIMRLFTFLPDMSDDARKDFLDKAALVFDQAKEVKQQLPEHLDKLADRLAQKYKLPK